MRFIAGANRMAPQRPGGELAQGSADRNVAKERLADGRHGVCTGHGAMVPGLRKRSGRGRAGDHHGGPEPAAQVRSRPAASLPQGGAEGGAEAAGAATAAATAGAQAAGAASAAAAAASAKAAGAASAPTDP